MHSISTKSFLYCTDCTEKSVFSSRRLRKHLHMRSRLFVPHSKSGSPKWRPMPDIARHHDRSPWVCFIKPLRVFSLKTARLTHVLLRRTQKLFFRFTLTLRYIPSNPALWDGEHSVAKLQKKRLGTTIIPTQKNQPLPKRGTMNAFVLVRNWRNSFLQTMEMKNPFPAIVRIKGTSSWETKPHFLWIFCNSLSNWLMKKRKGFNTVFFFYFLQFLLCNLRYKCPNWTDSEKLTESVWKSIH